MMLRVFSRRWGHDDNYSIEKTRTGWSVVFQGNGGECDKEGKPALYELLDHDSVNYPEALPEYLEWLWEKAEELKLGQAKMQEELDKIAFWIGMTEKGSPTGGIFGGFK